VLPPISYPPVLAPCADSININARIMQTYLDDILPGACVRALGEGRGGFCSCSPNLVPTTGNASPTLTPQPHQPHQPHPRHQPHHTAAIAGDGDDGNYGSAATLDVLVLQALSTRIHYGKFVAEAKFRCGSHVCACVLWGSVDMCCCLLLLAAAQAQNLVTIPAPRQTPTPPPPHMNTPTQPHPTPTTHRARPEAYTALIKAGDAEGLMALLTDVPQERRVVERVRVKGATFGQDIELPTTTSSTFGAALASTDAVGSAVAALARSAATVASRSAAAGGGDAQDGEVQGGEVHAIDSMKFKVSFDALADIYDRIVMPLTKDVQVEYLLRRLDGENAGFGGA